MAGLFGNHRVTSVLIIVFAIVAIQKIDGYPYQWPGFFSNTNAKQPVKESSNESDLFTSVSKDSERAEDTVESGQTIHYAESSLTYDGVNDESRFVGISQEKRTRGPEDDEDNHSDVEKAEKDDEDEDDDSDDNEESEDQISKLIERAIKDGIFQTSEKWTETLADKPLGIPNDEGTSVKIQKPRSPSDPQNIVTQTTHVTPGDRIVFPDEVPNGKLNDVTRRPVPSCKNVTFCVDTPYYPSDLDVDRALARRYFEPVTEPSTIAERIGPIDDENGLCISREEVVQPKTALDEHNEWRYIVNNEKYVQTVRVEICQTQNSACGIIDGLLAGYKTSCKQKFIYRQLVAFGPNGTSSIPFQMPSSCCCHVKFTGDLLTRLGVDVARSNQQTPVPKKNTN